MQQLSLSLASCMLMALAACETVDSVTNTVVSTAKAMQGKLFSSSSASAAPAPKSLDTPHPSPAPVVIVETTSLTGTVSPEAVIDGDTIRLQGKRVRLYGIDAPELSQPCQLKGADVACGSIAKNALIGFALGTKVRCEREDVDRYGRDVSRCYADGYDLSAGLVRAGLAVAYRKYSKSYVADEDYAKSLKRGMWKGSFVMPWDWRRQH